MSAGRAVGLLLGVAADAAIGDPRRLHPVAAFGKVAQRAEKALHRDGRWQWRRRGAGLRLREGLRIGAVAAGKI